MRVTTLPRRPLCLFQRHRENTPAPPQRAQAIIWGDRRRFGSADSHRDLADLLTPLARTRLVHRFATRIDGDCDWHVLYVEFVNRFHAEVGKADDFRPANGFRYQVRGAPDRDQISGFMLSNRFDRDVPA